MAGPRENADDMRLEEAPACHNASPRAGDALRYESPTDLSNEDTTHAQLVLLTGSQKDVLEIGPATGSVTKVLAERGCRVSCIEIDPVAAEIASQYCKRMIVGDVERIDLTKALNGDLFDVILFGDVLEHLVDPRAVLCRVAPLLRPEGRVIASVPNIAHGSVRLALLAGHFNYEETGLLDRTHLRFFTRRSLGKLFIESGFEVELWRPVTLGPFKTEMGLDEGDYPEYLVRALREDPDTMVYQFVVKARRATQSSSAKPISEGSERSVGKDVVIAGLAEVEDEVAHLTELEERMARLAARLSELDRELAERDGLIAAKDHALLSKDEELLRRDALLLEHQASLAQLETLLANRTMALLEEQGRLGERQATLESVQRELAALKGSSGYRLLQAYWNRSGRYFPPDTLRGRAYPLAIHSAKRVASKLHRSRGGTTAMEAPPAGDIQEPYQEWIARTEPSEGELARQRALAWTLAYRPLISIVVPTWNPPLTSLEHTVRSVQAQTYTNWELCIADGRSDPEIRTYLRALARSDTRVRIALLPQNEGISGNTNAALEIARGDFVAFLDHTDLLTPWALFEVAALLNKNPGLDCLYSDWDYVRDDAFFRFNPLFTPEWSPDMLLSANYMAHFLVMRRSFVEEAGGLNSEMDGAQDWDLIFRVTEGTNRVARIPRMLYQWRADASSAAVSLENKPYAAAAQERAVQAHLDREGVDGVVVRTEKGHLRVRWSLSGHTRVSIVVPTRHNRATLESCLKAVARSSYEHLEVLVVETAERDRDREAWYAKRQGELPAHLLFRVLWWEGPFNYSAVNNWAARHASGDVLLFLNDDTEPISPDWLEELVGWIEQKGVGAVGGQLLDESGAIQHSGIVIGLRGFADHLFRGLRPDDWSLLGSTSWYRNVSAVTGACLMVSRKVFEEVGGWDESFVLCGSDVELGLRILRHGYRIVCTPFAQLTHLEGSTRGGHVPLDDYFTSFWHYQRRLFAGDPYFNPSLSYGQTVPQLKDPAEPPPLQLVSQVVGRELTPPAPVSHHQEAAHLARACRLSGNVLELTRSLHEAERGDLEVRSINWFIPEFDNPFYGGIHTIMRFADHFRSCYGVENRFVVVGAGPEPYIRAGLRVAYPGLAEAEIAFCSMGSDFDPEAVKSADVSICTLWTTAYALAKFHATKRKFYFIQDFEPMFYPAGTTYSLAEQTYRLGFYGIANTATLKKIYESDYGGRAIAFTPAVDTALFYPRAEPLPPSPYAIFLYGRPGHPRNCYEVAIDALQLLKRRFPERVRVMTAGSWATSFQERDDESFLDHLGLLDYTETAELYRRSHAGLVLSVSKHPSYLPLQLMASGCLVVSNLNAATGWLLKDEKNCLLSPPTADKLCETLTRGLLDEDLRRRLTTRAATDVRKRHSDWTGSMDAVFRFLCDPEASPPLVLTRGSGGRRSTSLSRPAV